MATSTGATITDLYKLPDNAKAELVNGELVFMSPTGDLPSSASGVIYASLLAYARRTKRGERMAIIPVLSLRYHTVPPSVLMRHFILANAPECGFLKARRSLPLRSAVKMTTVRLPNEHSRRGEPTALLRVLRLSGMSIY
jgi:hypothetical protein